MMGVTAGVGPQHPGKGGQGWWAEVPGCVCTWVRAGSSWTVLIAHPSAVPAVNRS